MLNKVAGGCVESVGKSSLLQLNIQGRKSWRKNRKLFGKVWLYFFFSNLARSILHGVKMWMRLVHGEIKSTQIESTNANNDFLAKVWGDNFSAQWGNLWDKTDTQSCFSQVVMNEPVMSPQRRMESGNGGHFSFPPMEKTKQPRTQHVDTFTSKRALLKRGSCMVVAQVAQVTTAGVHQTLQKTKKNNKKSVWHRTGSATATDVHDVVMWRRMGKEKKKGTFPPFALSCWDTSVNRVSSSATFGGGGLQTARPECTSY